MSIHSLTTGARITRDTFPATAVTDPDPIYRITAAVTRRTLLPGAVHPLDPQDMEDEVLFPAGAHVRLSVIDGLFPASTVTAVTPDRFDIAGLNTVTIDGTNLDGTTAVTFGGTAADHLVVVSPTRITVRAPAHAAGAVNVVVTGDAGNTTVTSGFTYLKIPTVTSMSPVVGDIVGGTTVTLTGTHLDNVNAVTFGGTAGTSVTPVSPTSATVVTPVHAIGAVNVVVTSPTGAVTKTAAFTYTKVPTITLLAPAVGDITGGTTVVITGTHLDATTGVTFDGVAGTNLVTTSATSNSVDTPEGAEGTADVVLTTPTGAVTAAAGFTYTRLPTISTISPATGDRAGNTTLTITGTNLTGTTGVTFGGVAGTSVTVNSDTEVTVHTPAHAAGAVNVVLTTSSGSVTSTGGYTYTNLPSVTTLAPTSGVAAGGTSVTLTGVNLTGTTGVTFGGVAGTGVTVNSDTEVVVTSPAHGAGAVDVVLTTPTGTSTKTGGYTFT